MANWVNFIPGSNSESGKTKSWFVETKGGAHHLGVVKWYAPWRKYAFHPASLTVFEEDCLRDIAMFVSAETVKHRTHRALERASDENRRKTD